MLKTGCVLIFCAFAGGLAAVPNPVATRQFAHAVNLEQTAETSANASLGDLDGDGDLGVVVSNFEQVRFGDGQGAVYGLALGDLNGDGYPDIVAARSEAPNVMYFSGK